MLVVTSSCSKELSRLDKTNNSFHCRLILLFCFYCLLLYCIDPVGLDLGAATSSYYVKKGETINRPFELMLQSLENCRFAVSNFLHL